MSLIQHFNEDAEQLVHEGETYLAIAKGVFDVPEHVAATLTRFKAFWSRFDGELPATEPAPADAPAAKPKRAAKKAAPAAEAAPAAPAEATEPAPADAPAESPDQTAAA